MCDVLPSLLTLTAANSHYTHNPSVAGINECNRDVTTSAGSLEGTVADMGAPKAYFRRGNVLDRASL